MPLYEYECEANHHRFEKIQKFSDPPITVCPTCGSAVQKLMSSPAIQFKGSGWYITDYAKKDGTKAGKAGGASSEGSSEKGSETKSESGTADPGKGDSGKSDSGKSDSAKSDSSAPSSPPSTAGDAKKS